MIEESLRRHLLGQSSLSNLLTLYAYEPAIFSQEAPADTDNLWESGPQYPRIVFAEDLQGDPERIHGGTLTVDVMCKKDTQLPEDIEPVLRPLIDGYFFSNGKFVVSAAWKASNYFTQPQDQVSGVTLTFELLGFPIITTNNPNVIRRLNSWTSNLCDNLFVINYDDLPESAWKPGKGEAAIYWRAPQEAPAGWIPDTFQTIWRTATVKGHIFAEDALEASKLCSDIVTCLYAKKRLLRYGEAPIMVNRRNLIDLSADPMRTGQITIEATYGVIVHFESSDGTITNINTERKEINDG